MELARMCFVHSKGIHPIFVIEILRISEEKSLKFKITRYDYFIRYIYGKRLYKPRNKFASI